MSGPLDLLEDLSAWDAATDVERAVAISAGVARLGATFEHVETETYSCEQARHQIATVRHVPTGVELQLLPGGSYTRGAEVERAFDDARNWWSEDTASYVNPRAVVQDEAVRPVAIGKTPVTSRGWARLRGAGDPARGAEQALAGVSWHEAVEVLTQAGLRLPTEAEWEWACRAGTTTRYFWGDEPDFERCVCERKRRTLSIDGRTVNAFGLLATLGTVWEWVGDAPVCTYLQVPEGDPGEHHYRILRGGSWSSEFSRCRSTSFRFMELAPDDRFVEEPDGFAEAGFRVAVPLTRDYHPSRRFRAGDRLQHSKYGEGLVATEQGRKIQVQFTDGVRTLVQGDP
ncbi:MAG: SUMF1/EgtB/PvdO family nonheme iron enzyme [Planctomycetes bacterium]|nr:SUMF1/EgtB/PvdO family nonheme iron enzyme [Planctomycetota bacterium]